MLVASEEHKLTVSAVVLFFAVGAITAAYTFVDLLFLSSYPATWLPYLFLGKTVTLLTFTFLVGRLVSRGSRRINAAMLATAAVTIIGSRWLLELSITGFPFALALWLDAVGVLVGVIVFNAVNDVFDLRRMKAIGGWIHAAAGAGGLVFGLSVPSVINLLGADQLLYVMSAALAIAAIGTASLQPLPVSLRETRQSVRPLDYPLFVRTAIAFALLLLVDTFADFALKREIALIYNREQIGAFMGPFYGLTNALTVVLQMSAVGLVVKRLGIRGLLCAVPAFAIVAAVGLFLLPGLWMAAAFRMGETVLRRGFDDFGRALVANPLPSQVRRLARLLWNGVSAPIGTAAAALVLLVVPEQAGLQGVAVIVLVASMSWLLLVQSTMTAYRSTLEEAVRVHRFGAGDQSLQDNPPLLEEMVQRSLASSDLDTVQFGLELLANHQTPLPPEFASHLGGPIPKLRAAAIEVLSRRGGARESDLLLARLNLETEPEIRWALLEALAALDAAGAQADALLLLKSAVPQDRAGAVLVLLNSAEPEYLDRANAALAEMVTAADTHLRVGAARALGISPVEQPMEKLSALLADSDADVCIAALQAVGKRRDLGLMDQLVKLMGRGRVSYVAGRTLATFGEPAIDALQNAVRSRDRRVTIAALRALTHIDSPQSGTALILLNSSADVATRSVIAKEAAKFSLRFGASAAFAQAARDNVLVCEAEVWALSVALQSESETQIKVEIETRVTLAKARLLAWFAVATEPARVLGVQSLLFPVRAGLVPVSDRAKALELLETLTQDRALKKSLTVFETGSMSAMTTAVELKDEWLDWLETHRPTHTGGDIVELSQMVMLLRKCPLFSGLQGEALLEIAQVSERREMTHGERLFGKGDVPDGIYVVASGIVNVMRDEEILVVLKHADVLGELELLDDSPRIGDAVAATDGILLYINKLTFENLAEDIPEVLRGLAKRVVENFRSSLAKQSHEPERLHTTFAPLEEETAETTQELSDLLNEVKKVGGRGKFVAVEQGHSVTINGKEEEEIEFLLAAQMFSLRFSAPPRLIDPQGCEFPLVVGEQMLGRDERCDIVVDPSFGDISRQHVVIDYQVGGGIKVTNLSSSAIRVPSQNISAVLTG